MDKFDFMSMVAEILSNFETEKLDDIGKQMKEIIDKQIIAEKQFEKLGIR